MTPVERIADWVKGMPAWWKHAIRLSLSNGELVQGSLSEIYQVALMEHDLLKVDGLLNTAKSDIDTTGFESENHEVTIKSISKVINVGALASDQILQLSQNGITVIYGDNGAGKSGYSRILKHACLARGKTPEILGNVFEPSSVPSSAEIKIKADGEENTISWGVRSEANVKLKSIRVFDGEVSNNFVSDEDELGYKPLGLYVLDDLVTAIDYVKRQVVEETMPGNGLASLPQFGDTEAGRFVSGISMFSSLEEVDKHIATDSEIDSIKALRQELNDLRAKSPEQIRKEIINKRSQLIPFKKFIDDLMINFSKERFEALRVLLVDSKEKTNLADQLRERVLNDLPISNVGGGEWLAMWSAAEKFLLSNSGRVFPPKSGEDCPLCLQLVDAGSANKLRQFQEYVVDETSKQAKSAREALEKKYAEIGQYSLDPSPYESAISLIGETYEDFPKRFDELINDLKNRKSVFCQDDFPEILESIDVTPTEVINNFIKHLDQYLSEVDGKSDAVDLLNKKEQLLAETEDRKKVSDHVDSIRKNIARYNDLFKYSLLEKECNTRSVTSINSEICRDQVIQPIVKYFSEELNKFGFNRFKVEPKTRGRSGAQLLRLEISEGGETLVAKVASEGEQRCIAISCFLAEMRADHRKSAVIFDDPVNSLSHQWSGRVAKRLVEESLHRQVVVLTHDIAFYKYLLEESEKIQGASFNGICLERSRKRAGIVRPNPPWDALTTSARIKELRKMLPSLEGIDKTGTEQDFRLAAYEFYGYLREAWERLVEEKLLNQVVTRFGRGVQTNRLKRLVDLSEDDITRIDAGMSKCSAYFRGHDSAPAVGDPYPTLDEIKVDLDAISDFNSELQNKRKRS